MREIETKKNIVPNQKKYQMLFTEIITHIKDNEEIVMVLGGIKNMKSLTKHDMEAVLVCTNERMVMLNSRNLFAGIKSQLISVSYENLNDITISKGIAYDALIIDTKGEKLSLSMAKDISKVAQTYDIYETLMTLKKSKESKSIIVQQEVPSLKTKLIDLKELLDLGIITEEEFNEKKRSLLAQ